MVEAVIGIGSNEGDREANLRKAVGAVAGRAKILELSSVYETQPMYYREQPPFLNCVVVVETDTRPEALLRFLKAIEAKMGRRAGGPRYGPRPIDLDILLFGSQVVASRSLTIPHPRMAERAFVLVPLKEIRPRLVHPLLGVTVAEMLDHLETRYSVVKRPDVSLADAPPRPRRSSQHKPSPSRRAS